MTQEQINTDLFNQVRSLKKDRDTWEIRAKSCEKVNDELHEIIQKLRDVSSPYLKRKKETPRAECDKLNEVHQEIRDYYS